MDFQTRPFCRPRPQRYHPYPAGIANRVERGGAVAEEWCPGLCWLVSERSDWDGRQMPLAEALEAVVGTGFGTIISCIPGRLGYFEGEMPRDRNLLQHRP